MITLTLDVRQRN